VFQSASVKEVKYPLTSCQKMAMMRNIEKMITDALNDHREVICQLYAVRSVSDVTVTHKFLLSGDSKPRCEEYKCSLTVKHFLLECCSLKDVREKYFTYSCTARFLGNVDATTIMDFIKEVNFYHLV